MRTAHRTRQKGCRRRPGYPQRISRLLGAAVNAPAWLYDDIPVVSPPPTTLGLSPTAIKDRARKLFFERHPEPPWACFFCEEPITELGKTSRSLIVHHINEDQMDNRDENHGPSHYGCHSRYHQLKRGAR